MKNKEIIKEVENPRQLQRQTDNLFTSTIEIDVNDNREMRFWCKIFNASRPEIIQAIAKTQSKSWRVIRDYFLRS